MMSNAAAKTVIPGIAMEAIQTNTTIRLMFGHLKQKSAHCLGVLKMDFMEYQASRHIAVQVRLKVLTARKLRIWMYFIYKEIIRGLPIVNTIHGGNQFFDCGFGDCLTTNFHGSVVLNDGSIFRV